jgi:endo-1,4-beta-D-glucanase Y
MLLPGPEGFSHPGRLWTFNPSYLPLPVLRRLEKEDPAGPWQQIADNTLRMIQEVSPRGYVADWIGYQAGTLQTGQFVTAPGRNDVGSYDAIRVYLWAGMTPRSDPVFRPLLAALDGMRQTMSASGAPPEKVNVKSGATEGLAPFGYSAALVTYLQTKGEMRLAEQMQRYAQQALDNALISGPRIEPVYYNMMLSLFAFGWAEKRYQFRSDGTLRLSWEKSCVRAVLH